jgi:acylphosphatase
MIVELHAIIRGRVQGVGFRYTTRQYAHKLSLHGSVRNLPDGSVEIFAQGPKDNLERLLSYLKEEAFSDEIEAIEKTYSTPTREFEAFYVI